MAGMNFPKKSVVRKKIEKYENGLKQLSDPSDRIVVGIVGGSDRPAGPPGVQGFQACRASRPAGPPGLQGLQAHRASRPTGLQGPKGLQAQRASRP